MLAMILGILKLIGLVLLTALGVAAALLLLVLLVPVRYRAEGSFYGELKGTAGVSWLLHILSCKVVYGGELDMCVRVFGIRLGGRTRDGKKSAGEAAGGTGGRSRAAEENGSGDGSPGAAESGGGSRVAAEDSGGENRGSVESRGSEGTGGGQDSRGSGKPVGGEAQEGEESGGGGESRESENAGVVKETRPSDGPGNGREPGQHEADPGPGQGTREKKPGRRRKWKPFSFRDLPGRTMAFFRGIRDKLAMLDGKREQALAWVEDEDNRNTFRLLKKQAWKVLKHIAPRTVKGKLKFGFDDPYTTGRILTYISPFYGLYAEKLQLIPVFEGKALEGELKLKGRVRLGTLIAAALRVFMDGNFRKLLRKWREM